MSLAPKQFLGETTRLRYTCGSQKSKDNTSLCGLTLSRHLLDARVVEILQTILIPGICQDEASSNEPRT